MKKNNSNLSNLIEIMGWYGVVAILTAYALMSLDIIKSESYIYQLLNLTGATCIVIDALKHKNHQPAVLNLIWAIIALVAIIQLIVK